MVLLFYIIMEKGQKKDVRLGKQRGKTNLPYSSQQ